MENLLKSSPPDYLITNTHLGQWRRFMYPNGAVFAEFRTHATFLGLPWFHFTRGRSPETGARVVAKGVVAVGRIAVGGIAIGQASFGLVSIAQLGVGLLFGFAQAAFGLYALGQVAIAGELAVGQLAVAPTAVGQLAVGNYALGQKGVGGHVWSPDERDPAAVEHFTTLWQGRWGEGSWESVE